MQIQDMIFYIFTKKINGLITEFGGPNSHMSIRCNELQVPAAQVWAVIYMKKLVSQILSNLIVI